VIAEEVLPHVILGLFLLIFVLAYLAMKDDSVATKATKEEQPVNRYTIFCSPYFVVLTPCMLCHMHCVFAVHFTQVFKVENPRNIFLMAN
jgi:hypothetical protein